jgi:cell wall-associated NlpC family hydrolase
MVSSAGISGTAVGVATLGAVLVYAGFRGESPLQSLRNIASGKPPGVASNPVVLPIEATGANRGGVTAGQTTQPTNNAVRNAVVAAAQKYRGDIYSQAKRMQSGYSDCSSFVDKALKDAGIKPPGSAWATTSEFALRWPAVTAAQAQPGDIAVAGGVHMVLITGDGGSSAIGQQRPGRNVQTGTVAELMTGVGAYSYRTCPDYQQGSVVR